MSKTRWLVVVAALLSVGAGRPQDALVRARQLYNQRQYDAAIVAAMEARRRPELADAAGLVVARARLERYRLNSDAADLEEARDALRAIDPGRLTIRDRGEWVVGLGELLFLDGAYGAAAETLDAGLGLTSGADPASRDRVISWWAIAVDHQAQAADDTRRRFLYGRLLERMEAILRSEPAPAAAYWLAVAAAGTGDVDRAWDAAIAAWLRAPAAGADAASVRVDSRSPRAGMAGAGARTTRASWRRGQPSGRPARGMGRDQEGLAAAVGSSGVSRGARRAAMVAALPASCSAYDTFSALSASAAWRTNRLAVSYSVFDSALSAR